MPQVPLPGFPGICIDVHAIASGLVAMIDDLDDPQTYRNALRLGMLPNPLMEALDASLKAKALAIVEQRIGKRPDPTTYPFAATLYDDLMKDSEPWRRDFVKEVTCLVCSAIYSLPQSALVV